MNIAYYNENDPDAAAWLRQLIRDRLIAPGVVDERDVKEIQAYDLRGYQQVHLFAGVGGWSHALRLAGWPDDRPVWTGSCPCQPFSTSGRRKGADDERDLWPEMFRLIRKCRPGVVFGEQVPNEQWMDAAAGDLEAAGYEVRAEVRRADFAGAKHARRRFYWSAADTVGERQPEPWEHRKDAGNHAASSFGEADWLVDAVRRQALPFLCGRHDGLPERVGRIAIKGFGNAVVPQVAASFVEAHAELEVCHA